MGDDPAEARTSVATSSAEPASKTGTAACTSSSGGGAGVDNGISSKSGT